jgi:hypothetical protein
MEAYRLGVAVSLFERVFDAGEQGTVGVCQSNSARTVGRLM